MTSADRDPLDVLKVGDRMSIQIGDVIYTDTVVSIKKVSALPEVRRQLSVWQRVARMFTPKSRRRSLVVSPRRVEKVQITTADQNAWQGAWQWGGS